MKKIKLIEVRIKNIKGFCKIYKKNDKFFIKDGYILNSDKPLCLHSLLSIFPYYVALSRGITPKQLGISKDENFGYVQCLDPCEYTNGGTVIFEIRIKE